MTQLFSAESIIVNLSSKIKLKWVAGQEDPDRPIYEVNVREHATLIGHLNLIHKNIIQVIGKTECDYLQSLSEEFRNDVLQQIFSDYAVAIIMADGLPVPDKLIEFANKGHVPLLSCKTHSNEVVDIARFYLHELFSDKKIVHGVFMEVLGTGVLITGESSVGKSELALDLISRGHRLVADDAPELTRIGPDILDGRSPSLLRDFMEVRGLGVLNIREMYGNNALKMNKHLRLIVHMVRLSREELAQIDRLEGARRMQSILGVSIPEVQLPVAPGRNLSVLVEAAVRNYILRHSGYDATEELVHLQQLAINSDQVL
ncbi:MAG: HPr(Ser) kinase/phosphatase [Gammaproteobacteria bacterium]|jgi:HPr kinase/phosphorylase|nr:HPr(Ser) kinase/phosphatase [Gammaproteobacteria bacterium]